MTQEERKAYLEKFVQVMPPVPCQSPQNAAGRGAPPECFSAWLQRTGELPPDFAAKKAHYQDQYADFIAGTYHVLPLERPAVEAERTARVRLEPSS